jgi:hypothetical protein
VDSARVAADADQALETTQVCLNHLLVAGEREDQRDVDRAAASGHLFDGPDSGVGCRDLDQEVRPGDHGTEHGGLVDRGGSVVGQVGVDLDRDTAVSAPCSLPDRSQEIAGIGDVTHHQVEEQAFRVFLGGVADLRVACVAIGKGLLKDGRVRGHSDDRVLVDCAGEGAGLEQVA